MYKKRNKRKKNKQKTCSLTNYELSQLVQKMKLSTNIILTKDNYDI